MENIVDEKLLANVENKSKESTSKPERSQNSVTKNDNDVVVDDTDAVDDENDGNMRNNPLLEKRLMRSMNRCYIFELC